MEEVDLSIEKNKGSRGVTLRWLTRRQRDAHERLSDEKAFGGNWVDRECIDI
jgi:hypothetical protein